MKAEIIAIGTELLLGDIVNSNAAYLSQQLAGLGIDIYHHSVIGDNPHRISSLLKLALSRSDIVITTGGLGPTVDDVTVATISSAIGKKLIFKKYIASSIKNRFARRHIKLSKNNFRQAYIPEGAIILKNNEGTAPGLFMELSDTKFLVALPGPPRELKPMFENYAIPMLKKVSGKNYVIKSRFIKITGLPESKVCEKVRDILELKPPVTVGIYAKLGEVDLKITAKAKSGVQAQKLIAPVEKKIRSRLNGYIFGTDKQTLEAVVGELLLKSKKTLAIAESCTGGLIASRITDVPGSSKYFKMGIVAYNNAAKAKFLLDVGAIHELPLLLNYGAVSKQVAVKMAQGIRRLAGTDVGLAVTGIAGPAGGSKKKPVGLVYIAICRGGPLWPPKIQSGQAQGPAPTICKEFHFLGDRSAIKWQASQAALNTLRLSF